MECELPPDSTRFAALQQAYFGRVDEAKYRWQIGSPVLSATERQLVAAAAGEGRLLEVGCGEGGNLFHIGSRDAMTVGLDLSHPKVVFASTQIAWSRFVCADAVHLPFRTGAFVRVLCRDVLHHLTPDQACGAVAELFRVCRPEGEVILIEPNGRNPLMRLFALLVPAERGALRSKPHTLTTLALASGAAIQLNMMQPLPLERALLHYRYGVPGMARWTATEMMIRLFDGILKHVIPRSCWAYIVIRGRPRA